MQTLPIFYFPTTIVCVDDDTMFLDGLKALLEDQYNVITYTNSKDLLADIDNYNSPIAKLSFLQNLVEHEYYDNHNNAPINLNMNYLHDLPSLKEKHNEISILIIDHHMPDINGLELCTKLYTASFKKILLTGVIDQKRAINAFNNKLIDGFITKSDINLLRNLTDSIKLLEQQYFIELTKTIKNNLEISHSLPLSDPIFIDFFNEWIVANNIIEYYLIDKNGSFLTINSQNEQSYFIVHTDYSLNNLVNIYQEDEQLFQVINSFESRQKIPFFGQNISADDIAPRLWDNYLYKPNLLEGREKYYWCSIKRQ